MSCINQKYLFDDKLTWQPILPAINSLAINSPVIDWPADQLFVANLPDTRDLTNKILTIKL